MKTLTIDDIRQFYPRPCYDPGRYLPEGWSGTALDILSVTACPAEDRLWVVLHEEFIPAKTMRLFAVWCARQALALVENPDQRAMAACDVAERYANGQASGAELFRASYRAADAADAAAADAAAYAASAASAASAAASAFPDAYAAIYAASAYAAAASAAIYAIYAASAYAAAASAAARDRQVSHLRDMIVAQEE